MEGDDRKTFQLTTSQGGRRSFCQYIVLEISLSTHDLTRRSTFCVAPPCCHAAFQLTTSQGGRPLPWVIRRWINHLSTHDLTRRSTGHISYSELNTALSTHDLTRRSTRRRRIRWRRSISFQLTTSQGGRRCEDFGGSC